MFCRVLLADSSLLLCLCAWQSQGEGAPVPLSKAETFKPFHSVSPQEIQPVSVRVFGEEGVCVDSEYPLVGSKAYYHLKTAHGDLINAWSFYFLPQPLRTYPPFGILVVL